MSNQSGKQSFPQVASSLMTTTDADINWERPPRISQCALYVTWQLLVNSKESKSNIRDRLGSWIASSFPVSHKTVWIQLPLSLTAATSDGSLFSQTSFYLGKMAYIVVPKPINNLEKSYTHWILNDTTNPFLGYFCCLSLCFEFYLYPKNMNSIVNSQRVVPWKKKRTGYISYHYTVKVTIIPLEFFWGGRGENSVLRTYLKGKRSAVLKHLCVCAKSIQSCLTLGNPTDCSPPGSSVWGILQARILVWVAMPSSRESSRPRDQTSIS